MFIAACDSQKGLRYWQLIDLPITSTGTHLHRVEHNDGIVDEQTQPPLWQWSLHSSSASGCEVCGGRAFKTGGSVGNGHRLLWQQTNCNAEKLQLNVCDDIFSSN